jgi:LacI family transcriptional regulator
MDQTVRRNDESRSTIRDVAADAGVSVAAVSKVLRNAYGVSDALRQKVDASIERLGYRPSVAARGMRGRTFTVGILLVELSNPFLPAIVDGASELLDSSDYKALIGVGRSATAIEASLIERMIDNRMDGLLIIAPFMQCEVLEHFARKVPIVTVAHHEKTATLYDTVNSDDRLGAMLAVRAFIERGKRDIALVAYDFAGSPAGAVAREREAGYLAAMQEAGLSDYARILRLPRPGEPREREIRDLLSMSSRPEAMFVWSDLDAIPIINTARTMGLHVPDDLSLIGYDNSPVSGLPLIGLSSVDQAPRELGRLSADLLLSRIGGRRVSDHRLVEPRVVVRGSLGRE